jgi:Domain of unknown function (DUF5076)
MFRKKQLSLDPPPLASSEGAREILRLWVAPEWSSMQVSLLPNNPDPAVWGIALVDVARHAAKGYALDTGMSEDEALRRIRQVFDAEWSAATDMPEGRIRE